MKVAKLIITPLFCLILFNVFSQDRDSLLDCAKEILLDEHFESKRADWLKSKPLDVILNKKLIMKGYELEGLNLIWSNDYRIKPESKYFEIHIEVWEFKEESYAELACSRLGNLIQSSSFFEKPPKKILLHGNFCMIVSTSSIKNKPILHDVFSLLEEKLSSCF